LVSTWKSNAASAYGAAGSLVVVLVWVIYYAQILLFGAEFTQVYANRMGKRLQPTEDAKVVTPKNRYSECKNYNAMLNQKNIVRIDMVHDAEEAGYHPANDCPGDSMKR
jgi:hypothetical protein